MKWSKYFLNAARLTLLAISGFATFLIVAGPTQEFVRSGMKWDPLPACTVALMSMLGIIALK